ncbi:hypothetical protein MRY87_04075 [bacterium]|nr:hypothetical protein [bacterium]
MKQGRKSTASERFVSTRADISRPEVPPESLPLLEECEEVLLQALRAIIGEAQSLTYKLSKGRLIRLSPENDSDFNIELLEECRREGAKTASVRSGSSQLRVLDQFFPEPHESESAHCYYRRYLNGLDLLIDEIAAGEVVELVLSDDSGGDLHP